MAQKPSSNLPIRQESTPYLRRNSSTSSLRGGSGRASTGGGPWPRSRANSAAEGLRTPPAPGVCRLMACRIFGYMLTSITGWDIMACHKSYINANYCGLYHGYPY